MSPRLPLTAPLLVLALLLAGCPRPIVPPPLPPPPPPTKEAFAHVVALSIGGSAQQQLVLRQFGLSPLDFPTFDKASPPDSKLDENELRDAFDLKAFDAEEMTRFFSKGPDSNQTLPKTVLSGADGNGDGRITRDEWILYAHTNWLSRLKANDAAYQSKVVMLWSRSDTSATLDPIAPHLFSAMDNNTDGFLNAEEVAAFAGIANGKTFEASRQGAADLIDRLIFPALLKRCQGTLIRKLNEMYLRLDKNQDGVVSKNELSQGANDPANEGVPNFIQPPKETIGRLDFERLFLRAADKPAVQKALVKWTWPENLPEP